MLVGVFSFFPASLAGAQTITLSGNVPLTRLVDVSAAQLGVRIDYDPAQLQGAIILRDQSGMTPEQLWDFTNIALASRGWTTIRQPGSEVLSVVKLADAANLARTELLEPTPFGAGEPAIPPSEPNAPAGLIPSPEEKPPAVPAGFVNQLVRVTSRPAKDVINDLRPLLSKQGGNVSAIGDSGLILISDTVARVEQAKQFLAMLDRSAATLNVEEIPARNLGAEQLATLATQVAQKRRSVDGQATPGEVLAGPSGDTVLLIAPPGARTAWLELLAQLDQRESVATKTYTPGTFQVAEVAALIEQAAIDPRSTDDRFRIVQDDLTGTLIITATPKQHEQIDAIIARLSEQATNAPRPIRAFAVRNRPVDELLGVLTDLIDAGALDTSDDTVDRAGVREAGDQQSLLPQQPASDALTTGPRGNATDSGRTSGSSSDRRGAGGRGDRGGYERGRGNGGGPRTDLVLTADEGTNTIIAIGDARTLSQLEQLLTLLDVRQPQVMLEVTLVSLSDNDALSLGLELEKIDSIGDASLRLSSLFGLSSGGAGGRTVGDARGLSGVVLSPGEFSIVARALQTLSEGRSTSIPKVLVTNNQQATFASVLQQPFQTATSSSGGTAQGFGGFQDAGTTISVRPQIAEGDELVLEYSLSLSSFVGGSAAPGLPPPRQQNKVDSLATLPDGYTVVVGGLEFTNQSDSEQRVPGLGTIPLIGELFKSRDNSEGRQRFFVFIRATILRDQRLEDLKYLSATDAATVGVPDGWPSMEPRIIR
jgi:type II secretory pathway component GspD/PulD (secretin)